MWEEMYPIGAKSKDSFVFICDTLYDMGCDFTFFRRSDKLYIIYVFDKWVYDFVKEIFGMGFVHFE